MLDMWRVTARYLLFVLAFLVLCQKSFGQQQGMYNQYLTNLYYFNPAFAGVGGSMEFSLMAREQWLGYAERPRTYSLNYQMNVLNNPLLGQDLEMKSVRRGSNARSMGEIFEKASMGAAGTIFSDINGRVRRTGIQAAYSYQILMGDWLVAAGLGVSFMQYKVNVLPKDLFDPNVDDPLIAAGKPNQGYAPDFNVGAMCSNGTIWGGLSVNALMQNALQFGTYNEENAYKQLRQVYVMGGYNLTLRPGVVLEPSTLITFNSAWQWGGDVCMKIVYQDRFWGAVAYRTLSDMILMAGVRYGRLSFSYAFSYTIAGPQTIGRYGTHEFAVGFRVTGKKKK